MLSSVSKALVGVRELLDPYLSRRAQVAVSVVAVGYLAKTCVFYKWRVDALKAIQAESRVVPTPQGPVEYQVKGSAPYILLFHGTPGGCDMVKIAGDLDAKGFGSICISRPGYLRTPLASGPTFAEQADLAAYVLDHLKIDQVAVHGISGGGPSAVNFAARHPDKTKGLLLSCAITGHNDYADMMPIWLMKLFMTPGIFNFNVWMTKHYPEAVLRGSLGQISTFSPEGCAREAKRIAENPEQLAALLKLNSTVFPVEDRADGFANDLAQFVSPVPLPLEKVSCPTLIVHGVCDGDVPFALALNAASKIPQAKLYAMERGHHLIWMSEGADAMRREQDDFLATL